MSRPAVHAQQAKSHVALARSLLKVAEDSSSAETAFDALILAQCYACKAEEHAEESKDKESAESARALIEKTTHLLSRIHRPNPTKKMARYDNALAANMARARAQERTGKPHYIYVVASDPKYVVLSEDHPVHVCASKGLLQPGRLLGS